MSHRIRIADPLAPRNLVQRRATAHGPEECDPVTVELAIREIHDRACGGNPQTAPVAGRFRIYRKSKKIEWYDVDNDDCLEFSKVHSIGGR